MSAQLEIVKVLAAKAQAAQPWELKPVLLAFVSAIINWMEEQEAANGNGTKQEDRRN